MPPAGDQGQPGDLNHLLRGKEYTRCMGELGGGWALHAAGTACAETWNSMVLSENSSV